jgi:hypothetical protein
VPADLFTRADRLLGRPSKSMKGGGGNMGFAWIISIMFTAYIGFVLGRKYQDLQDILLARRVAKLVDQRKIVNHDRQQWDQAEEQSRDFERDRQSRGIEREKVVE